MEPPPPPNTDVGGIGWIDKRSYGAVVGIVCVILLQYKVPFIGLTQIIIEVFPLVPTLFQPFMQVVNIDTTIPIIFFHLIFCLL